jgi:hypothetical protein
MQSKMRRPNTETGPHDDQLRVHTRLVKMKNNQMIPFCLRVLSSIVGDGVQVLSLSRVTRSS